MKQLSNVSNCTMHYLGKAIPPRGVILLSDDGTVIEEIADNTAAIENLGEELRNDINALSDKVDTTVANKLDTLDTQLSNQINDIKNNMVSFNYDKTTNTLTIEEVD